MKILGLVVATVVALPIASADRIALKKQEPIKCTSEKTIKLKHVVIDTKDVAVEVSGKCAVEIVGSHIVGGKSALLVTGKGSIDVSGSTVISRGDALKITSVGAINIKSSVVHGKRHAIRMTNRGSIYAEGTQFYGRKKLHHLSSYGHDGKSSFKRWRAYKQRTRK